jgi:hypothetical protein
LVVRSSSIPPMVRKQVETPRVSFKLKIHTKQMVWC